MQGTDSFRFTQCGMFSLAATKKRSEGERATSDAFEAKEASEDGFADLSEAQSREFRLFCAKCSG